MISVKAAKKFIDDMIIQRLDQALPVLTIADLGPKAKQTDVAKVKELIRERIAKIRKTDVPKKETKV